MLPRNCQPSRENIFTRRDIIIWSMRSAFLKRAFDAFAGNTERPPGSLLQPGCSKRKD